MARGKLVVSGMVWEDAGDRDVMLYKPVYSGDSIRIEGSGKASLLVKPARGGGFHVILEDGDLAVHPRASNSLVLRRRR